MTKGAITTLTRSLELSLAKNKSGIRVNAVAPVSYTHLLMDLKRENNWLLPSKRLVTIDTEVTRLKDEMPVSVLWFCLLYTSRCV